MGREQRRRVRMAGGAKLGGCCAGAGDSKMPDQVNHPPHYTAGAVECIDAIAAATPGLHGVEAVCTGAAIKYLWRWKLKGGAQDLEKARWYINKLLGEV